MKEIVDITEDFVRASSPGSGSVFREKGFIEKDHIDEIECAEWLVSTFGGSITQLSEDGDDGENHPDYEWNGKFWDLKMLETSKTSTIEKRIRKGRDQIRPNPGGLILDFTRSQLSLDDSIQLSNDLINRKIGFSLEAIIKKGDSFKIFRYITKDTTRPHAGQAVPS